MEKNWDDVQELSYITAPGKYTLKVASFKEGESINKGTEYHEYTCETKDKETIRVTLYLVDKALWRYKAFVKALGLEAKGNVNFNTLPETLMGRKFVGDVTARVVKQLDAGTGDEIEKTYYEVSRFEKIEQ